MDRRQLKTELLLLFALVCQVCGQCKISKDEFSQTTSTVVVAKPGVPSGSPRYEILNQSTVDEYEILHIYYKSDQYIEIKCVNRVLTPLLPLALALPTTAKEVPDSSCPKTMFAIGYKLNGVHIELYRSCYDRERLTALFSTAKIYLKTEGEGASRPTCDFVTSSAAMTPPQEEAFKRSKIEETFKILYGDHNTYSAKFDRGHLAPACDFLTSDQKRATFDYVNVVPQFSAINQGNWQKIEQWVLTLHEYKAIHVETGAVGVLQLLDEQENLKPAYLYGNKIPVPEWVYKVIRNENNVPIYTFLSYNNVYSKEKPKEPTFCKTKNISPPGLKLRDEKKDGYIFFCEPTQFHPHKENVE